MDEALCSVTIDISGRPYLVWNGDISGRVGSFDVEVAKEFFLGFVREAKVTLHVNLHYGENVHHRIESVFKAFGRALREATSKDEFVKGVLSTKGVL
jgi:imidazoleglycerol-phosphate dehydratase